MDKSNQHASQGSQPEDKIIDEELYSRQLYVLGHEAMRKMQNTNILIIGLDGLGQEIAKNVILAGVNKVVLYDSKTVKERDLGSGFYFSKKHINTNRAEAVFSELNNINKYVKVEVISSLSDEVLQTKNIVVSVNQTNEFNIHVNNTIRKSGSKFVMANSRGFFSQLFVDFSNHLCLDKTGDASSHGMINSIVKDGGQLLVHLTDGTKHNLDESDHIKLVGKHDNTFIEYEATVGKFKEKNEFYITDIFNCKDRDNKTTELLTNINIHYDFEQIKTPFEITHSSLEECIKDQSKIVKYEYTTETIIHDLFFNLNNKEDKDTNEELIEEFKQSENTLIAATCSMLGGFAAQEVIKGASGKFIPLNQLFYHHTEGLYAKNGSKDTNNIDKRYTDIVKLIGKEQFNTLAQSKIFLVGAGAIGCENMKNFVMSGLCSRGMLHVTDMDSIERSNLNRQFLFKDKDVGKQKSECACMNTLSMNDDYSLNNFKYYTTPVKQETEGLFSDTFLESVDIVSNALDNIQARMYMDERCVQLHRPMVDAGTLGTKGHVQVVVPKKTESYGSSSDAEQDSIPLCTIRSYPNCIEHTIEWALAEFKSIFQDEERVVSDTHDTHDNVTTVVKYALYLFNEYFNVNISKQLGMHPPDHLTEEGIPFWLPPKKLPHPIKFSVDDELHMLFVVTLVKIYLRESVTSSNNITDAEIMEKIFTLKDFTEETDISYNNMVEFEKDSYHSDLIYALSNIRARNYDIKEQTKHYITGVAGKIIPAIATTTAMVSGLAILEIMKILLGSAENKNSFLDLAHPMVCSADPIECSTNEYTVATGVSEDNTSTETKTFTMWDYKDVEDKSLSDIISELSAYYSDTANMLSVGSRILYWDISNKYKGNLEKKPSEIVDVVEGQKYIYLTVFTEDEQDREVIRVLLK